ncbi:EF hand, partial [Opisthorchis viverrini]
MARRPSPQELEAVFTSIDRDGSNTVHRKELEQALLRSGLPPKNADRLMKELDVNGDGIIKLEEYRFALGLTDTPAAEWKRLFAMLDQDRSGTASVEEIRGLFSEVGLSYSTSLIEDWIRECDVNNDGKKTERTLALGKIRMCHGISAQQLEELFQSLDRDGNGSVDREELAVSLKEAGIPGKNAEHSGVSNGPYIGCTTLQLFTHTKVPRQQNFNRTLVSGSNFAALRIIQELDVNQDGHITLGEYRLVMGLTDEPIAEWKRLFNCLDADRSGKVDVRELKAMFDEMCMSFTLNTLQSWIEDHDINGDGKLTYQEFLWKRLFVTLDSDRSGKVDKRELQQMFNEMGMHFALSTLEDWIADHDVDGDGKLTYQEFMGFVAEQIAHVIPPNRKAKAQNDVRVNSDNFSSSMRLLENPR